MSCGDGECDVCYQGQCLETPCPTTTAEPTSTSSGDSEGGPTVGDSRVGYIDNAIPGNIFRLRYDTAYNNRRPNRAEFFWPRGAPLGPGVPFTIGPYRLVLEESTEMDPRSIAALDPEQVTGAFHVEPDEGDTIERSAGPLTLGLQTGVAAQGTWRVWVALGAVLLAVVLAFVFWK